MSSAKYRFRTTRGQVTISSANKLQGQKDSNRGNISGTGVRQMNVSYRSHFKKTVFLKNKTTSLDLPTDV